MKEVEILVELTLEKTLLMDQEENRGAKLKAMRVLEKMTNKECK